MSRFHPVVQLLDKLSNQDDVDVRFMCLRDLAAELERMHQHIMQQHAMTHAGAATSGAAAAAATAAPLPPASPPLDANAQSRLCRVLLLQLMCTQGDVHEAAVRCLPALLSAVGDGALLELLDSLLLYSFSPARALPPDHLQAEELADEREKEARIESLRMKALQSIRVIWRELTNAEVRTRVAKRIVPPVVKLIQLSTDKGAKSDSAGAASASPPAPASTSALLLPYPQLTLGQLGDFVSFLSALLSAHPASLLPFHATLLSLFHSLLMFQGSGLLKLSMECVNAVVPHLTDGSIGVFVRRLCAEWGEFQSRKREAACLAALTAIIKVAANRFQPYLSDVLPLLRQVLDDARYEPAEDEREAALLCVESIIRFAASVALPHLSSLLPSIRRASSYDPNFVGEAHEEDEPAALHDDDEGGADGADEEEEDYGMGGDDDEDEALNDYVDDGGDDGNADDDEDSSWKVRRAAARCAHALLGVVVVASGAANEQQQQAYAHSLPPIFVSTHVAINRPVVEELAVSLAALLLPRLTERTEYIQVELISHYEQLLLWAARIGKDIDLTGTQPSTGPTLQQQLCKLLGTAIKAKSSAGEVRSLEQATSLLHTAVRSLPPHRWQSAHTSLFAHMTRRLTESLALLPSAPQLLGTSVNLVAAVNATWQRVPSVVWSNEASSWSQQLLRWMSGVQSSDRISTSHSLPLIVACTRALGTLVGALRAACPQLQQAEAELRESRSNVAPLLPLTQLETSLDPVHERPLEEEQRQQLPGAWSIEEEAAVATIRDVHRRCVALLQDGRADRTLQAQGLQCMGRLYATVFPLASGSVLAPSLKAALQQLLSDGASAVWDSLVRLVDFPNTRVVACEMFFHVVRFAPLPAAPSSSPLQAMLLHCIQLLKQRDRFLLRLGILSLNTLSLRCLLDAADGDYTEALAPLLQQAVQPILAFTTESGELAVEQSCALVLLANLLRLLSRSAPLRVSTVALIVSHVFPTLSEWLHSNPDVHPLALQAVAQVYEGALMSATDQQRQEWSATLRAQATHANKEDTRSSLVSLLSAALLRGLCDRVSAFYDLGVQHAARSITAAGSAALHSLIESEWQQTTQLTGGARVVSIRLLGHLLQIGAGCQPPLPLISSFERCLAMFQSAESPSVAAAWADSIGRACIGADNASLLLQAWKATPVQLALCLQAWCRELTAMGVARASPTSLSTLPSAWRASAQLLVDALPTVLEAILAAASQLDVSVSAALLSDLCLLAPAPCLSAFESRLQQSGLDASSQQSLAQSLRHYIVQHHAQSSKWKLRMSVHVSVAEQTQMAEAVARVFAASLVCFTSSDLGVLLACVQLLHTLSLLQPTCVLPQLRALLPKLVHLVRKEPKFVREVSYGPSTKLVDGGVDLRLAVWTALVSLAPLLSQVSPADAEAQRPVLLEIMLVGLGDPAADVCMSVHSSIGPLIQRVPLDEQQRQQLSQRLQLSIQAPPPENAVREELLAHAEVVQSATRVLSSL